MGLRTIREEGDPVLRKKCKEVTEVNDRIRDLLDDLTETMRDVQGVGLAAPQVGILRRVEVVEVDGVLYELINPVIVESEGDQYEYEACLSCPGKQAKVHRPAHVRIEALDRNGNKVSYEGEDLLARAFCHETDHLDGILYVDKAEEVEEFE
ncbi:MAG: peptide deformylase [Bacillota bacterium]|nr:peptide deformylase [Bacillota bacterium]